MAVIDRLDDEGKVGVKGLSDAWIENPQSDDQRAHQDELLDRAQRAGFDPGTAAELVRAYKHKEGIDYEVAKAKAQREGRQPPKEPTSRVLTDPEYQSAIADHGLREGTPQHIVRWAIEAQELTDAYDMQRVRDWPARDQQYMARLTRQISPYLQKNQPQQVQPPL